MESFLYYGKKRERADVESHNDAVLSGYRQKQNERVTTVLGMVEGNDVLDVGCAAGTISRMMAENGFNVLGIDRVEEYVKVSKEFNSVPNISFELRDVLEDPFPPESFDCITFLETIEHVENPSQFLKEYHRILRPGGHLIISTPNATSLKNFLYALSYRKKEKRKNIITSISKEPQFTGTQLEHISNWDFPTIVRLLDKAGFEIVEHKFTRAGPIIIPILGRRVKIIGGDSKILNGFEPLKTTHVIKCKKK